jgi:hypothetical protein
MNDMQITPPPMPKEVGQWSVHVTGGQLESMLLARDQHGLPSSKRR